MYKGVLAISLPIIFIQYRIMSSHSHHPRPVAMPWVNHDALLPADPIVTGLTPTRPGYRCIREHGLSSWTLVLSLRGRAWYVTPDRHTFDAGPNTVMLIAPQTPHHYGVAVGAGTWRPLWAVFKPPALWEHLLRRWPEAGNGHYRLDLDDTGADLRRRIISQLHTMHTLSISAPHHRQWLAMNALEAALLWVDGVIPDPRGRVLDTRVRRAADFVRRHLADPIGLLQIAEAAGVSVPHVCRLFREHGWQSPAAFVEAERIARARQLLEHTAQPIHEIACLTGFASPFYFSSRFRKAVGESPRAYRARVSVSKPLRGTAMR